MIRIPPPANSQPFGALTQTKTVIDRPNVKSAWRHYLDTDSTLAPSTQNWKLCLSHMQSYCLVGHSETTVGSNNGPHEANSSSHTQGYGWKMPYTVSSPVLAEPQPASYEPLDIRRQLEELKDTRVDSMQPAETWGTEYSKAPSPSGLDWLADRFGLHYPSDLTKPWIYSTPEGGVQAKWSLAANKISLEVNLETHVAEWHCLNLDTGDSHETPLELNTAAAWLWLVNEVRAKGKISYWQQAMDHVQTLPAVRLLLSPVKVSDIQQQVEQFDLPSSDEKERFLNSLWDAFEIEPLESGFDHPSEGIIREAMLSMEEEHVLEWLRSVSLDPQHPSLAASVLRCLGRLERPGTELWCAALVRSALGLDEPEIRDAAVQAAESWGGKAVRIVLEAHTDPLPWLDDYIGAVIKDLEE